MKMTSMILATRYGFLMQCDEHEVTNNHVIRVSSILSVITLVEYLKEKLIIIHICNMIYSSIVSRFIP